MGRFKVGDKVEHVLTGEWLLVLETFEDDSYICRRKNLDEVSLFGFEIKKV